MVVKKSLVRAPLLMPFLFVAACNTTPVATHSLATGEANPAAPVAVVEAPAESAPAPVKSAVPKARYKVASLGLTPVPTRALEPAQTTRQDAAIAEEIARNMQSGRASWYGPGFHGRRTASGERFQASAMTAAHRTLPFGTRVRVTHVGNGRSVVVRINDRGPFHRGRIIDLAAGPAQMLGLTNVGSAYVSLQPID
jgi:rare lipoprotein A